MKPITDQPYLLCFDLSYDTEFQLFLPSAYVAKQNGNSWYVFKKATPSILAGLQFQLTEVEQEALSITSNLQRDVLLRKFIKSSAKSVSMQTLYEDRIKKQTVQHFIEDRTHQLLELIEQNKLWLTVNLHHSNDLMKNEVEVTSQTIIPTLDFEKTKEGIAYRMYVVYGGEKHTPMNEQIELLNDKHSWVALNKKLVRLAYVGANKLRPFLTKEEIRVPEKILSDFFDKFLKEILKKVEINTEGFDVVAKSEITEVTLFLTHDFFTNHYKIYVGFDYGGQSFFTHQQKSIHSDLEVKPGNAIEITQYKRNAKAEKKYLRTLTELGFEENQGCYQSPDKGKALSTYELLLKEKETLLKSGFLLDKLAIDGKKIRTETITLETTETFDKNDWFDLHITIKQGGNTLRFSDILPNIRTENPIYELPDGSVFVIPSEWFSKYGTLSKYVKVKEGKVELPKNNYALLNELPELQPKTLVNEVIYRPSPNLKATLRPYQTEGVKWLLEHHHNGMGACLADDMGLGKTLQTIALLVAVHDDLPEVDNVPTTLFDTSEKRKEPLKALVILPSSLVFNWYDETKRFAPHFKCIQYVGADRKRIAQRLLNYDLVFTSYPIVTRDSALFEKLNFRYVILDESQRIKNKSSKVFKTIHKINATHKISLSGTPIENSLSDLWSQMQFINPNILGSFSHFTSYFKVGIEKKNDPVILEELKTIISPFLLRRTKEQVLDDLPEMTEQVVFCEMSDKQAKWYEEVKSRERNKLLGIGSVSAINALQSLMLLRQISNHPNLTKEKRDVPSGKFEEVVSQMENIVQSNRKALIFSSFVKHLEVYEQWCKEQNISYAKLTGGLATHQRKDEVEAFQKNKNVKFFFISLKAGEVGLNLTEASQVLLLDPWWNPFSEKQAIGRAHRIGQKNKVNVMRFVTKATVEEKIIRLQQSKTNLSQSIVEDNMAINDFLENLEEILE